MTPAQRLIERLNAPDKGPSPALWIATAFADYEKEKGNTMEDSKKTTIATVPATPEASAAAGQAAGQAAHIAAALAGAGAAVVTTVLKPGWKTSEFWLTAVFAGATELLHLAGALPGPWGWIASGAGVMAYNISRGLAKR